MAFTVQEFRSQLQYDGARPNLFEVRIALPVEAVSNPSAASTKFTFMCRAAALPGSIVQEIPVGYFGRDIKVAGNRQFTDWNVTVFNDEDFTVHNAFMEWMNALNGHASNLRQGNMVNNANYQREAEVLHWGKAGNLLKKVKLIGAFPVDVSPIDLAWNNNNTIEEFSVTFAYQYWQQLRGDDGAEFNNTIA